MITVEKAWGVQVENGGWALARRQIRSATVAVRC